MNKIKCNQCNIVQCDPCREHEQRVEQFNYLRDRYLKLWGASGTVEEAIITAAEHSGIEVIETDTQILVVA